MFKFCCPLRRARQSKAKAIIIMIVIILIVIVVFIIIIIIIILIFIIGVRVDQRKSIAILPQTSAVHLVLCAAACRYHGFLIWI